MAPDDLRIELAEGRDAATISEIAVRAFHTDVEDGAAGEGGPPGYDSPAAHPLG